MTIQSKRFMLERLEPNGDGIRWEPILARDELVEIVQFIPMLQWLWHYSTVQWYRDHAGHARFKIAQHFRIRDTQAAGEIVSENDLQAALAAEAEKQEVQV